MEAIANELKNRGERVSATTISKICKKLFEEIGEKEPGIITLKQRILDSYKELIIELWNKGSSCGTITKYLRDKEGARVSEGTIRTILRRLSSCSKECEYNEGSELRLLEQRLCEASEQKEETAALLEGYRGLESRLGEQELGEQK